MKKWILLSHAYLPLGVVLTIAGLALGSANLFFEFQWSFLSLKRNVGGGLFGPTNQNFTDELALTILLSGLLILSFTRMKTEDERVHAIRLEAYQWSFLVHFIMILLGTWSLYDEDYFYLMVFNLFTPLVVFLLRFYYVIFFKENTNEE